MVLVMKADIKTVAEKIKGKKKSHDEISNFVQMKSVNYEAVTEYSFTLR